MICTSPRESGGFRMFAASSDPSAAPAPMSVCISSMKRITLPLFKTSSMTPFIRSSNSPRYFAPATRPAMGREMMRFVCKRRGTAPVTMRMASPSATAVLPTPGSPMRIGLFFVRLERICTTRSISFSLPMTGSSLPSFAIRLMSLPYLSKSGVPAPVALCISSERRRLSGWGGSGASCVPPSMSMTVARTMSRSAPSEIRTRAATPSFSRIKPRRICSVPM